VSGPVPAQKHPPAESEPWKNLINLSRARHVRQLHAGVNLGRICLSLKFFITLIRQKCYLPARGRVTFPVGTQVFLFLLLEPQNYIYIAISITETYF
uniref:Uncharacterized protein n=1 Tax=Accipiter nisus TaxID=211598 RepID=A0A8B9LYH1_9AVES